MSIYSDLNMSREEVENLRVRAEILARQSYRASDFLDRMILGSLGMDSEDMRVSRFPEYSEEKFDSMGNKPLVKEIMAGATMLTKEQREERIKKYLK